MSFEPHYLNLWIIYGLFVYLLFHLVNSLIYLFFSNYNDVNIKKKNYLFKKHRSRKTIWAK